MRTNTAVIVCRCAPILNRLPSARRRSGLFTFLLSAAAMIAFPTARAATMYVSGYPDTVYQVSPAGVASPFATLPAHSAPHGLAFDGGGNLYVADSGTQQITRITSSGAVSLFATLPFIGSLPNPDGLAFDGSGNLYVADFGTSQIAKITSSGAVSIFATLPFSSSPSGLAFDGSGNLYVAVRGSNRISKITSAGAVSLFATLPATSALPVGLAFDSSGNLYAACDHTNQVIKITSDGTASLFATLPTNSSPAGLTFDANGNLYAADFLLSQISQISPNGSTVTTFATGITGPQFIAFAPVASVTSVPLPSSAMLLAVTAGSLFLLRRWWTVAAGSARAC
jgi:sugar lactone lactonase YvrE